MTSRKTKPAPTAPEADVFDLDAVEAEARATPALTFTLRGHEYRLAPVEGVDYRALMAADTDEFSAEDMTRLIQAGMTPADAARFADEPLTLKGLTTLFNRWNAGIVTPATVGESEASTGS